MLEEVRFILSKDFSEIYTSELSLQLLSVYSKLYLSGGQPKHCKISQMNYYNRLKSDGIEKAKKMEEILKKTNKAKKKGFKYVGKPFCKHFNLEQLTDKEATDLLQAGWMNEGDFSKLPEIYKEEKEIEKQIKKEEKAIKKGNK